jgi:hypothetical protein
VSTLPGPDLGHLQPHPQPAARGLGSRSKRCGAAASALATSTWQCTTALPSCLPDSRESTSPLRAAATPLPSPKAHRRPNWQRGWVEGRPAAATPRPSLCRYDGRTWLLPHSWWAALADTAEQVSTAVAGEQLAACTTAHPRPMLPARLMRCEAPQPVIRLPQHDS